jgi:hypothetical protein
LPGAALLYSSRSEPYARFDLSLLSISYLVTFFSTLDAHAVTFSFLISFLGSDQVSTLPVAFDLSSFAPQFYHNYLGLLSLLTRARNNSCFVFMSGGSS